MTAAASSPGHDSRKEATIAEPDPGAKRPPICGGKKRGKSAPDAKRARNPVYDANGNELCSRPAGWGTTHPGTGRCKLHGGSTTTHQVAATIAAARTAVVTFGLPREIDPRDALLEEVYRTAGAVAWLTERVRALDAGDKDDQGEVIWGVTQEVDKQTGLTPGTDTTKAAAVNLWVQLWQTERDRLVRVSKVAIDAGLEERKVRLAEQQGALLAGAIRQILGDLDLSPEQQALVPQIVPRALRAVAALPGAA